MAALSMLPFIVDKFNRGLHDRFRLQAHGNASTYLA